MRYSNIYAYRFYFKNIPFWVGVYYIGDTLFWWSEMNRCDSALISFPYL
nr:MAG TPA: hypothetical protein [Caudoviricetes sp.]